MNDIFLEFDKYASNFDMTNEKIIMKYNHTFRVVNIARTIAKSINLSKKDIDLAVVCALLHDIARFKQATEYDTFKDSLSFDHGDVGEEILKKDDYIYRYITDKNDKELVLNTVKNHNKLQIDSSISEKDKLFCKIVRDADKVDILQNQARYPIKKDDTINEKIFDSFRNKRLVYNCDVTNNLENILREVAFIYDLVFQKSYEILYADNTLEKIFENIKRHYQKEDINEIYDNAYSYVYSRIRKKVG